MRLAEIFGFDEQLFRKNKDLRKYVELARKGNLDDLAKCATSELRKTGKKSKNDNEQSDWEKYISNDDFED